MGRWTGRFLQETLGWKVWETARGRCLARASASGSHRLQGRHAVVLMSSVPKEQAVSPLVFTPAYRDAAVAAGARTAVLDCGDGIEKQKRA